MRVATNKLPQKIKGESKVGIIKEQFEKNGSEYLSNYLIGAIKGVINSDTTDKEKISNIEKLLNEYDEVQGV